MCGVILLLEVQAHLHPRRVKISNENLFQNFLVLKPKFVVKNPDQAYVAQWEGYVDRVILHCSE